MRPKIYGSVAWIIAAAMGCGSTVEQPTHLEEVLAWRADREAIMRDPEGYLAIVGLFELQTGESTFGAGDDSAFRVTPAEGNSFAETIGTFEFRDGVTTFHGAEGIAITDAHGGEVADPVVMEFDGDESTVLRHGSLTWVVIRRGVETSERSEFMPSVFNDALGAKFYVRVWDAKNEALDQWALPEFFPVDPAWRFQGEYRPFDEARVLYQKNVLGLIEETPTTGVVAFTKDGVEYELETADEGDNLFIVFGDATNGEETWSGGRFMDIPKPVNGTRVIVDFNQTRNPWCAYSPYTTCAYPTQQNTLPFAVRAGALKPATSDR